MKIKAAEFQNEFAKSLMTGVWTERMGSYMLAIVDNVSNSGILHPGYKIGSGDNTLRFKDAVNEIKGFAIELLLEKLWDYNKKDKNSRALYYAIAITKNLFRKMGRECLGSHATKTLQGTDFFGLYYDDKLRRYRKGKAYGVEFTELNNLI